LRLALDVDVAPGNEHASKHAAPGLWALLDRIPRDCWPAFLRGDSGFLDLRRRLKDCMAIAGRDGANQLLSLAQKVFELKLVPAATHIVVALRAVMYPFEKAFFLYKRRKSASGA
jgi:hypothetical protein